jgi:hypothetical protein
VTKEAGILLMAEDLNIYLGNSPDMGHLGLRGRLGESALGLRVTKPRTFWTHVRSRLGSVSNPLTGLPFR